MSHSGPPSSPTGDPTTLPSASTRPGLSIRSILLIMLLLVSTGSSVVVGLIGYVNGRDSLREAAFSSLTETRDSRAREITGLFDTVENTLLLSAAGQSVAEALQSFSLGFDDLATAELAADERAQLQDYFATTFAPQLSAVDGTDVDPSTFVPSDPAQRFLQLHYTVPFASFDDALANDDAGDGSTWSAAHAQYHDYFRRMIQLFDYEDVLLLDARGNVIYTAFKGVDLGTNLDTGPLQRTKLADAYSQAMTGNVANAVMFTDFAPYPPSLAVPAAWALTPVAVDGAIIGALAIEMPIDRINAVMTGGADWQSSGLGRTGETYIVGANDNLMRSTSRALFENAASFQERAIAAGTPPRVVEQVVSGDSTLLVQPVNTDAVTAASAGQTGTTLAPGYLGAETIAAYAPLDIKGVNWVIVAQVDSDEAFAPVAEFTRNLVLSAAIIVLAVSLLSLIIAGVIVRPLRRLRDAARRIAAGELGVQVDAGTSDELADVGAAFNDMSRSLQVKAELLEAQEVENERLLLTLMPEPVARKYKQGQRTIALDHTEVSVMFADIVGFEAFSRGKSSEQALELLNEIIRAFDEAADRLGIERARTTRSGYLASCGTTVPRVDSARRIVDYAIELERILERFGGKHGATLSLRAGLATGTVTSGLVGESHIAYDLWGDAVNLSFQIQANKQESGIFLTQTVVDRMPDTVHVRDWGVVTTPNGPERVWRIDPDDVHA